MPRRAAAVTPEDFSAHGTWQQGAISGHSGPCGFRTLADEVRRSDHRPNLSPKPPSIDVDGGR